MYAIMEQSNISRNKSDQECVVYRTTDVRHHGKRQSKQEYGILTPPWFKATVAHWFTLPYDAVLLCKHVHHNKPVSVVNRERSGSVVEYLTRDRRAAGSSLTGVTALWSLSKTHLS